MIVSPSGPRQYPDRRLVINNTDHWSNVTNICWSRKDSNKYGRLWDRWYINEVTTRLTVHVIKQDTTPATHWLHVRHVDKAGTHRTGCVFHTVENETTPTSVGSSNNNKNNGYFKCYFSGEHIALSIKKNNNNDVNIEL